MSTVRNCPLVHASVAVLNPSGQLLLVQEEKPAARGKWNLPGGHMEAGESVPDAASRELLEETTLRLPLVSLVGIYSGPTAIRFVFQTTLDARQTPAAGHEILAVRWVALPDLLTEDEQTLVSPANLRTIVGHLQAGQRYPLSLFNRQT